MYSSLRNVTKIPWDRHILLKEINLLLFWKFQFQKFDIKMFRDGDTFDKKLFQLRIVIIKNYPQSFFMNMIDFINEVSINVI